MLTVLVRMSAFLDVECSEVGGADEGASDSDYSLQSGAESDSRQLEVLRRSSFSSSSSGSFELNSDFAVFVGVSHYLLDIK
jgi:hypothetical protein